MIYAVVLAAGFSSRMGQDKALLKYDGKPNILHLTTKLKTVFDDVLVVAGKNFNTLKNILPQEIEIIENKSPEDGMFSSILLANTVIPQAYHLCIQMIDQPFISISTYQKLQPIYQHIDAVQPAIQGRAKAGHPLVIYSHTRTPMNKFHKTQSFRDFYKTLNVKQIPVQDEEIYANYNTPESWFHRISKYLF